MGCVEALKEAMKGQYSKGIKAAIKAMENAKSDYKATISRVAEASRRHQGIIFQGRLQEAGGGVQGLPNPIPQGARQGPNNPRGGGFSTSAQQPLRISPLWADHFAPQALSEGS